MDVRSWVELAGRHAAAATVSVSGVMRTTVVHGDSILTEGYSFWHAPNGRWRIERDGEVLYISTGPRDVIVRIDGVMRRQRGDFGMAWFEKSFSPLDLLGPDSLLTRMSASFVPTAPRQATVAGRSAWVSSLASVDGSGSEMELAFDSDTGVLVRVSTPFREKLLEVEVLREHDRLDDSEFEWRGPVRDTPAHISRRGEQDADDPSQRRQLIEVLTAQLSAVDRRSDVLRVAGEAGTAEGVHEAIKLLLGVSELGAEAVAAMTVASFRTEVADMWRAELRRQQNEND